MSSTKSTHYRPEIDGLRALAVIPVVCYHLGLGPSGGYVGVDIFFVISGYLITGIILKELGQSRFSIANFYKRRVLRILPAFIAVLTGTLIAAWYLFLPYEMEQLGKHLTAVCLMISNLWLENKASDYWSPAAESFPLLHTWSLAVEEQFYVIMPLVLIALYRWQKRYLKAWMFLLAVISLVYCVRQTQSDQSAAFYLLPSRSWELLIGSFLATFASQKSGAPRIANTLSYLGLGMILISLWTFSSVTSFPGYAALLPTIGTALILFSNQSNHTVVGKLLALAPIRGIGLISYSLYLWHWPIIVFLKSHRYPELLSTADKYFVLALSLTLSIATWRMIEQPFRKERKWSIPLLVNSAGIAALLGFVAISLTIRKLDGYPNRFQSRVSEALYQVIQSDVLDKNGSNQFQAAPHFLGGGIQHHTSEKKTPQWVVLGDSHGAMMAPVISELADKEETAIAFFTQDGFSVITEGPRHTKDKVQADIASWRPKTIFFIIRWDTNITKTESEQMIAEWLRFLSAHCEQLYVTLQVPMISDENLRASKLLYNRARRNNDTLPDLVETDQAQFHRNETIKLLHSLNLQNLQICDLSEPLLDGQNIRYHSEGRLYYRDNDHLNVFGARTLQHLFLEQNKSVANALR